MSTGPNPGYHASEAKAAYEEALSDAYREGFGAGIESADSDRDEALAVAERRGYERAVARLRDHDQFRAWLGFQLEALGFPTKDEYPFMQAAVDYLEATKETTP